MISRKSEIPFNWPEEPTMIIDVNYANKALERGIVTIKRMCGLD